MNTPERVRVPYRKLLAFARATFCEHGLPPDRAHTAAATLCYGDLRGLAPHGLAELASPHLAMLNDGRADPGADPETLHESGACALLDAHRALGLWAASETMDSAIDRAQQHGVGLVSVRNTTPFGCAGVHAIRATRDGMIGVMASTNAGPHAHSAASWSAQPIGVAAPAIDRHPFVLDLTATMTPQHGFEFPAAERKTGRHTVHWPDADPAADPAGDTADRFGLGPMVPLLSAMLSGATTGLPDTLNGTSPDQFTSEDPRECGAVPSSGSHGSDAHERDAQGECIQNGSIQNGGRQAGDAGTGFVALALAPAVICPGQDSATAARSLFSSPGAFPLGYRQNCTPYPGWIEAERATHALHNGVPLPRHLYEELVSLGLDDAEQVLPTTAGQAISI